jgi:hypothetical protein
MTTRTIEEYEEHVRIIAALRRAYENFRHHVKFTQRARPIIEAELPMYQVSVADCSVRIWKDRAYDQAVDISWSSFSSKSWQENFECDLARQDPSDTIERMKDEARVAEQLAALEAQVCEARRVAKEIIEALPVPKAATIRSGAHFWSSPSTALTEKFPQLFGRLAR